MPAHKNLTGADLHEPKGIAGASAGAIYVADGAGSGAFSTDYVTSSVLKNKNLVVVSFTYTDISTAGSKFVVIPLAGKISKIYTALQGAITGANTIITAKIGGVSVTNGAVTIGFSGSAAGDVDNVTPTALNIFTAGSAIEFASDGGSTGTVDAVVTLLLDVS